METNEAMQWLKKENLYDLAKTTSFYLKKIFHPCFGIKDEKILIIGDRGSKSNKISPVLSAAYYLAAEDLKLNAKLIFQAPKTRGGDAEPEVIDSLDKLEEKNVVFINMSDKLGGIGSLGKSFRKFCEKKKHRFISALSLGDLNTSQLNEVIAAIDVDYKPMLMKHEEVKQQLDNAKELHITTKAGTDLHCSIEGMKAVISCGCYTEPGKGGNLPAGEVYIPPNGKNVYGKIVIDGSSRNHYHTALIKTPIVLTVEEGSITKIEGKKEAEELQKALDWAASKAKHPSTVWRIGEIGIGLNPKAKIIGSTLVDEKALGTAHVGIGSNYWFGGKIFSITHLDQIFKDPVIKIDGKKLEI